MYLENKRRNKNMNKKRWITISAAVLAIVFGFGVYQSSASQDEPKLSSEDIENLVMEQYPGKITEMELEKDHNKVVYEVEVEVKDKEYDLELDGNTGEVLKLKEKIISPKKSKETTDDNKSKKIVIEEKDDDDVVEGKETAKENNTNNKTAKDKNTVIDVKEASNIALKEFSGTITSVDLDEDDGRLIYEIEIDKGHQEAEIEIDAYTGEILVIDIDD